MGRLTDRRKVFIRSVRKVEINPNLCINAADISTCVSIFMLKSDIQVDLSATLAHFSYSASLYT
jgi:hypothetical protein